MSLPSPPESLSEPFAGALSSSVSSPSPPATTSLPVLPVSVSAPRPPEMTSSPGPPSMTLSRRSPVSVSLPEPPVRSSTSVPMRSPSPGEAVVGLAVEGRADARAAVVVGHDVLAGAAREGVACGAAAQRVVAVAARERGRDVDGVAETCAVAAELEVVGARVAGHRQALGRAPGEVGDGVAVQIGAEGAGDDRVVAFRQTDVEDVGTRRRAPRRSRSACRPRARRVRS